MAYELYVDPSVMREAGPSVEQVAEIAGFLGITPDALKNTAEQNQQVTQITRDAPREACLALRAPENRVGWAWCDERRLRIYPMGSLASQTLGFVDYDQIGRYGIEQVYDEWLKTSGTWGPERAPGTILPLDPVYERYLPSPNGRDMILHTHGALQFLAEKRLAAALRETGAESGNIVIMRPEDGGILAMAAMPTFDLSYWSDAKPGLWTNPVIASPWEPGSIFKLMTWAAALDTNLMTPESVFFDSGRLEMGGNKTITNAEKKKFGNVTAEKALQESLNVVSAQICLMLGADVFYRYIDHFGFGRMTEVDQNAESAGLLKRPGNKYWSQYDQAANSFGQGISVTPIQVASAVAAIANDGVRLQPSVVDSLVYDGRRHPVPARTVGQVIRPETAKTLTRLMVSTYDNYDNSSKLLPGYRVAGKTGTAQIPTATGYSETETAASFVGFFPAADPQVVVLVKLMKPKTSRWAEKVALPLFGVVARDVVQVLKLPPDDRMP
jgi:cell division protein FtsI/penicillin-binding protein 2